MDYRLYSQFKLKCNKVIISEIAALPFLSLAIVMLDFDINVVKTTIYGHVIC